jgi:DNA-binding response OmpR family regulator
VTKVPHILLIEDEPNTLFAMTQALSTVGYVVSSATSVEEGVATLCSQAHFDAVLLDLRLGPDRGTEIFIELHERAIPHPPIVILSAQTRREIDEAARMIKAKAVIQKPVSLSELYATLESIIA